MIISSEQLLYENRAYANPQSRVQTMVKKGELIPLKRGLFETDTATPGFLMANALLGPSYLSFEYALSYYSMIPERVVVYTSATFGRNKKIEYNNQFGSFTYRDIPAAVFPYYYTRELSGNRPYLIATREKALCDQLCVMAPIRGIHDFREWLFDGMRLDEDIYDELDSEKMKRIAPLYHRINLDQLVRLLEKERR
ncbi:MAG: hypothetical protein PHY47_18255 [Lachnospiraceae bacterium]|nr:hypothetical protein [Lachnospiraceae bacterium]